MEKLTTLISDFSKNPSCISSDSCGLNQSADALSKVFKQPNFLKQNSDVMQKKQSVIYQKITDYFIEKLENGIIPWRRTWGHYGLAQNYVTKHTYTGINMVVLNMISPFDVPYFLTWNQIEELGGKVKKGSKSLPVIYFKTIFKDENGKKINETRAAEMRKEDKEIQKIPFTKYYNVFNVEQIEGIDFEIPELTCQDNQSLAQCEQLIDSMEEQPVFVSCNVNQPYYSPSKDVINMPDICQFENSEEFYNTTWHELIHWTGHEKRLAR